MACRVIALVPYRNVLVDEASVLLQLGVGLCDEVLLLVIGIEVLDLLACLSVDDLPVRSLEEAVLVDPCVVCQRDDETDVRTFRGLDRAHASVMCVVDVSDLESRAVTVESAASESCESSLVGELRKWVDLVHEL